MIAIAIVDDHRLVRDGLRQLLARFTDLRVVWEAGSGAEALALCEGVRPDVVLLDLGLPDMGGPEVAKALLSRRRASRVIAVSANTGQPSVVRALRAGARGYVLKDESADNLHKAIRAVHDGGTWFSRDVGLMLARLAVDPSLAHVDPLDRLSPRQRVVLQMIAEGKTNRDIAAALAISESTVDSHRLQLMRRLDMHNIAALVRFACREGLVSLD